ncbi:hypothetical protein Tco_0014267 [Tanacetum coccineum]
MVKSWLVQDQTVPELAIPEQTATGKGIPNPLMAGSLPKTIKPTELDVAMSGLEVPKIDFRSFMMDGIDGEFHFELEGGVGDGEGSSPSIGFVNNKALVINVEPLNSSPPLQFAENIGDSNDAPLETDVASKASGDPSNPLEVDSYPDLHDFPSAKELKDSADCHWVVAHVTPPSWKLITLNI